MNVPYSGTERALMNFENKIRSQLVETICFNTHIDIFDEENFNVFWGDRKLVFDLMMLNRLQKLFMLINLSKNIQFDLMNIEKVSIFRLFGGFLMENYL